MKKKLFLTVVMAFFFAVILAFAVSAESVHNENTVDYSATVTLNDGTVLPLYDENKEALIWYISGNDENGKNIYSSIRTDDPQVKWWTKSWGEVTAVSIVLDDGTKYGGSTFVVVNMMDDDVKSNTPEGNHTNIGNPIRGFKWVFSGFKNLEYVYLRLDTTGIFAYPFSGCTSLKYVNLESLTKLERIGDSNNFAGCTSLFKGQVLDLSNSKLWSIDWGGSFNNVPFVGIKLPSTVTRMGGSFEGSGLVTMSFPVKLTVMETSMFKNCIALESVALNNKLVQIKDNAFLGCTSLEKVFFVGSLEQLNTLLAGVSKTGNDPFWSVVGENNANVISYNDYRRLSDKSGKYVVYDYSYCEAYTDGAHELTPINACAGLCSVCGCVVDSHSENAELDVTIEYTDYASNGVHITACKNEGCTYRVTVDTPALIINLGYSVPEKGAASIVMGFKANKSAIEEYERITAKTVRYGVFVATQNKLGENPIFDANGNVTSGVISAEIAIKSFDLFELKVSGFTDEHKDEKLTMGAYVAITDENITEYSYLQDGTKGEKIGNYFFASFNDITK